MHATRTAIAATCNRTTTVTLRYVTLRYVTLRYVTLRYVTLRYVTLRYDTIRYDTLCYVKAGAIRCSYIDILHRQLEEFVVLSTLRETYHVDIKSGCFCRTLA